MLTSRRPLFHGCIVDDRPIRVLSRAEGAQPLLRGPLGLDTGVAIPFAPGDMYPRLWGLLLFGEMDKGSALGGPREF